MKPLKGIEVIDFTGVQAGPVCTQFLARYGADVLNVERINGGDVDASVFQLPDGTEWGAVSLYWRLALEADGRIEKDARTEKGK